MRRLLRLPAFLVLPGILLSALFYWVGWYGVAEGIGAVTGLFILVLFIRSLFAK